MDNVANAEEKKPPQSFGWLFLIALAVIVPVIYELTKPRVIGGGSGKSAVTVEATNNARQIGLALHEFEKIYGAFPNDQTKLEIEKGYVHKVHVGGTSSNALFRQLIASGIASEQIFYAKVPNTRKPDNEITRGRALLKGEVAFAYVTGLSSNSAPTTPVAICPIITGTDRFDPKPFKGKAVILRVDNSVSWFTIRRDARVYDKGINLLSAKHPVWKGKAPDIRYPE